MALEDDLQTFARCLKGGAAGKIKKMVKFPSPDPYASEELPRHRLRSSSCRSLDMSPYFSRKDGKVRAGQGDACFLQALYNLYGLVIHRALRRSGLDVCL